MQRSRYCPPPARTGQGVSYREVLQTFVEKSLEARIRSGAYSPDVIEMLERLHAEVAELITRSRHGENL